MLFSPLFGKDFQLDQYFSAVGQAFVQRLLLSLTPKHWMLVTSVGFLRTRVQQWCKGSRLPACLLVWRLTRTRSWLTGRSYSRALCQKRKDLNTDPDVKNVLPQPQGYQRAALTHPCGKCKRQVQTSFQFCPHCREANNNYDEIQDAVSKGARAPGFKRKPPPLCDMEHALDFSPSRKKSLTKVWGDILAKVNSGISSGSNKIPAAEAPADPVEAPPARDDPASAVQYLSLHWSTPATRKEVEPILQFCVSTLKGRATRAEPLSEVTHKEILGSNILMKPRKIPGVVEAQAQLALLAEPFVCLSHVGRGEKKETRAETDHPAATRR